MNWDKYFKYLYESKKLTDITASAIKTINVLGEAGVPGFKELMGKIDKSAYNIAIQSYTPTRQTVRPDESGLRGKYTGYNTMDISTSDLPDINAIFLGLEENTLPMSEYNPTSWTNPDPEQGWRSIKDMSKMVFREPSSYYGATPLYGAPHPKMDALVREMRESLAEYPEIDELISAVNRGEYDPSKHAVKFSGGNTPPMMDYSTDVNLAHFTQSLGYDSEKGQYYTSITDVWDFEPEVYSEIWKDRGRSPLDEGSKSYTQASLMEASGKSIGIYDRYYLPEGFLEEWGYGGSTEDKLVDSFIKADQ